MNDERKPPELPNGDVRRIPDDMHALAVRFQEHYSGSDVFVFVSLHNLTPEQLTQAVSDLGLGVPSEALNGQQWASIRRGEGPEVLVTAYTVREKQQLSETST